MPPVIRVLIVDDSALIRQMLTRALSMDPRIDVVGIARNGVEAIERASELRPDVVTLDIEMPEMTGLEALPYLRKQCDARVLMLSSLDDPDTTYRALSLGAVDFIPKPSAGMATSINELTEVLLKKIRIANRIAPESVALNEPPPSESRTAPPQRPCPDDEPCAPAEVCVALAASTGGPPALEKVFSGLPRAKRVGYVIVQHLPKGFTASMARRLGSAGEVPVSEAVDGEVFRGGRGYIAPHGAHLVIENDRDGTPTLRLTAEAPVHGVRPAADPLLRSVAETFGGRAVGVVLSGMGSDGALGALAIRRSGGHVVVQDERTSVVWGMPGAALRAGAADRTVGVGLVAAEIRRSLRSLEGGDSLYD